jgi:hypothetical protein
MVLRLRSGLTPISDFIHQFDLCIRMPSGGFIVKAKFS